MPEFGEEEKDFRIGVKFYRELLNKRSIWVRSYGRVLVQGGWFRIMLSESRLNRIKELAIARNDIVAIYVFGSFATCKDRRASDIDLAIMVRGHMAGFERVELETCLSNLLGKDVDLTIFGQANPFLQHQILKYGYLVYERDAKERVRQEVMARSEYLDSGFLYKTIRG
jgi:uncharacterized protein